MKVRNPKGKVFETTRHDFETLIVAKGNASRYEVIEDDAPLEVRKMRDGAITEIKKKKQSNPETDELNK